MLFSVSIFAQENVNDLLDKGINLISKKDYKEAIEVFNKAEKINSNEAEIYAHRGQAKHFLGLYKEAIEDYNMAIQLQPDYAEVYHLRGLAKGELKDNIGACEDWQIAVDKGENLANELIDEFCQPEKGKTKKK